MRSYKNLPDKSTKESWGFTEQFIDVAYTFDKEYMVMMILQVKRNDKEFIKRLRAVAPKKLAKIAEELLFIVE